VFWSGNVEVGASRAQQKDRVPCLWSLDTAAIQWNGNVVMCAIDCDGKYVAGNIQMQALKEIWNGPLRWMRTRERITRRMPFAAAHLRPSTSGIHRPC